MKALVDRPKFCKAYQEGQCDNDPATCPHGPHLEKREADLVTKNPNAQAKLIKQNAAAASSRENTPTPKAKAKAKAKVKP